MIVNTLCRLHTSLAGEVEHISPGKDRKPETRGEPWPTLFRLSPRRAGSCLETAKRFTLAVDGYRNQGKDQLLLAIREERRRIVKFSLSLLASSVSPDSVFQAFVTAGFIAGTSSSASETTPKTTSSAAAASPQGSVRASGAAESGQPQNDCETFMLISGTQLALKNAHPIAVMRAMTAYLGFSVFNDTEAWLVQKFGAKRRDDDELIIPGDLPDTIFSFSDNTGLIDLAVRLAGMQLLSAALAGCPRETITVIEEAAFSPLGAIVVDEELRNARSRHASEELSDAQDAFPVLMGSVKDLSPRLETEEERWKGSVNTELVSEISQLILELDNRVLKSVVSNLDTRLVASLIQAMEPIAHDRLFSCVASSKGKKILDALEASAPLGENELTRKAQIFAQKVLSEIAPRNKTLGKSLPLPAKVRQLLTAILSRE